MANTVDKMQKKRLRSSNFTVVISIALVLFLLGLTGLIIINAQNYFNYLKEQLVVEVFLKDYVDKKKDPEVSQMQLEFKDSINNLPYVKSTRFVTKQMAYQIALKEIGPDKLKLIEENIFPASIQVTLKSDYVNPQQVNKIKKELSTNKTLVDEVKNDDEIMYEIYNNIDNIMMWLIAFAILFLIIAMVLINNSIRLKIFSKRFIIKTMQLVGARRRFIIKPFLIDAFWLGLTGGVIACILLYALWFYITGFLDLPFFEDYGDYFWLGVALIITGILIAMISTYLATWRFLKLRTDDLYYS